MTVENWKKASQKGQTEDAELKRLQELAKYAIVGGVPVAVQEALTLTLHFRKQNQTNKQTTIKKKKNPNYTLIKSKTQLQIQGGKSIK